MNQTSFSLQAGMHLHLVGIGGAGISAIARVLLGRGFVVSGSDRQGNELTAVLRAEGATIYEGHRAEQVAGADALIISSAIPADNPEVAAAREAGIPVLKRADLLGHLMAGKKGIAVAGSHGKSTTTGMIAQILLTADLDPTVIVGGVVPLLGSNGRYGQGPHFVIEADEYDYMFLGLRPATAIVTSVEHDHPDMFATMDDYLAAFVSFVGLLPQNGRLLAGVDDEGVRQLLARVTAVPMYTGIVTYGLGEAAGQSVAERHYRAADLRPNQLGGTDFVVLRGKESVGLVRLRVPGEHNVKNGLAALLVALDEGVPFATIQRALAEFGGIGRRFQVMGEVGGVTVIDDYAHHPTAIRATLAAARQRYPGRRLWAVWQPHTYSRTRLLLDEFAGSFAAADRVIALDIYGSRERDTLGMDAAVVVRVMNHPRAIHIPCREDAAAYLLDRVLPDDVILLFSAGDGNVVGEWVLEGLRKRMGRGRG
jgi:UDP-N-acetylmuramate--alanine ligase